MKELQYLAWEDFHPHVWLEESLLNLYIVITYASKYANNRHEAETLAEKQIFGRLTS